MSENYNQEAHELISDLARMEKQRFLNPLENRALQLLKQSVKEQMENE